LNKLEFSFYSPEIGVPAIRIAPTALKLLESGAAVVVLPVSVSDDEVARQVYCPPWMLRQENPSGQGRLEHGSAL
jgi:hypothetical protein